MAEQAEAEIEEGAYLCRSENYSIEALSRLRDRLNLWCGKSEFRADTNGSLRLSVLNNITFLLSDERLRAEVWKVIRELAAESEGDDPEGIGVSLTISTFELAAEPPEVEFMLDLLYSLADDQRTRWAVFAAYEHYPSRIRAHALKYSSGAVSDDDCIRWLHSQGLE